MDLYSYVGNDPVNKTDSTGLSCEQNDKGVVTSCKIDKGGEKLTQTQRDAYNNMQKKVANGLLSAKNKSVTVKNVDGTTAKVPAPAIGRELVGRNVVYDPKAAGTGAHTNGNTTTIGQEAATGLNKDGSTIKGVDLARDSSAMVGVIIIHEAMHGIVDRNVLDVNNRSHQKEFNNAAEKIYDEL